MDGDTLVQRWTCSRVRMPDGSAGVRWRGVVYPLLSDDHIDIGASPPEEPADPPVRHAVLPGEEASWVLIQGLPADLDAARRALERGGVVVSRTGRWLGEPVGEVAFDWFLRCDGKLDEPLVTELLGASPPGVSPGLSPVAVQHNGAARLAVLEQRIADLLADMARAESALRHAMAAPPPPRAVTPPPPTPSAPTVPDPALQSALAEIQALRSALEDVGRTERSQEEQPAPPPPVARAMDEAAGLLAVLRPDIVLLRDTLITAFGTFDSRTGFYRALAELPPSGSRPEGWKMLRGAERWWECHVSTGRNDHGRAYARFHTTARYWSLLLGVKVDQPRDIAWLRRQG